MKILTLGIVGTGGVEVADKVIHTSQAVDGFTADQLIKYGIQLAIGLFTVYLQHRLSRRTKKTHKPNEKG